MSISILPSNAIKADSIKTDQGSPSHQEFQAPSSEQSDVSFTPRDKQIFKATTLFEQDARRRSDYNKSGDRLGPQTGVGAIATVIGIVLPPFLTVALPVLGAGLLAPEIKNSAFMRYTGDKTQKKAHKSQYRLQNSTDTQVTFGSAAKTVNDSSAKLAENKLLSHVRHVISYKKWPNMSRQQRLEAIISRANQGSFVRNITGNRTTLLKQTRQDVKELAMNLLNETENENPILADIRNIVGTSDTNQANEALLRLAMGDTSNNTGQAINRIKQQGNAEEYRTKINKTLDLNTNKTKNWVYKLTGRYKPSANTPQNVDATVNIKSLLEASLKIKKRENKRDLQTGFANLGAHMKPQV